jgi:hypothetical protein
MNILAGASDFSFEDFKNSVDEYVEGICLPDVKHRLSVQRPDLTDLPYTLDWSIAWRFDAREKSFAVTYKNGYTSLDLRNVEVFGITFFFHFPNIIDANECVEYFWCPYTKSCYDGYREYTVDENKQGPQQVNSFIRFIQEDLETWD